MGHCTRALFIIRPPPLFLRTGIISEDHFNYSQVLFMLFSGSFQQAIPRLISAHFHQVIPRLKSGSCSESRSEGLSSWSFHSVGNFRVISGNGESRQADLWGGHFENRTDICYIVARRVHKMRVCTQNLGESRPLLFIHVSISLPTHHHSLPP